MKQYLKTIGSDFSASIVVFLVAVPLCLGIAGASGVPEFSGIIGGIIGGIVIGIISKSNLSVSGPAAGLTSIVAAAILEIKVLEAFFLAVVIAGVLQIIMGSLKMGIIGDYVPNSVIKGMLAGIGIILVRNQFPKLFGYNKSFEGEDAFINIEGDNFFSEIVSTFNHITPIATLIGLLGLAILIIYETEWIKSKKVFQLLSGPLLVVVLGTLINVTLGNSNHPLTARESELVVLPVASSAEHFFSFFRFPEFSYITNSSVWIAGITLAIVASLETLLGIEAVDKLDPLKRVSPANRELVSQGIGNMTSGLLGGLPLTSVIVRSSANVNAGGKTKMSTILHGALLLVCVALFPKLLNMIPKAALAAILVFTGYKLAKVGLFKQFYNKGWEQFMPFVVTVLAIVFTDLLKGVVIGIAFGIFFVIRSNFRTAIFSTHTGNSYLVRLRKDISFFSKAKLKSSLEAIPENSELIIDLSRAEFIDLDIIDTINEFSAHAHLKNISVTVNKSTYNKSHQLLTDYKKPEIFENRDDNAH